MSRRLLPLRLLVGLQNGFPHFRMGRLATEAPSRPLAPPEMLMQNAVDLGRYTQIPAVEVLRELFGSKTVRVCIT